MMEKKERGIYMNLHVNDSEVDILIEKLKEANSLTDELASKTKNSTHDFRDKESNKLGFDSDGNLVLRGKEINKIIFKREKVEAIKMLIKQG